jgi:hypothetical protein
MGKEEASVPGVIGAAGFALLATLGNCMMPSSHEVAWLCLFGCSLATFFASFKQPVKTSEAE